MNVGFTFRDIRYMSYQDAIIFSDRYADRFNAQENTEDGVRAATQADIDNFF